MEPVTQGRSSGSTALPSAASAALSSEALVAYQQTMRQFLSLQERVVQQFLGGTPLPQAALPAMPSGQVIDQPFYPRLTDLGQRHPVTRGLPESFPVTDELYLCPIDESAVIPLARAEGFAFTADNFYSAANAVAGAMFSRAGWSHPQGSNCIAWESRTCPAPLVYLQCGDGPATYANPHVRRMLANALDYTSGEPA